MKWLTHERDKIGDFQKRVLIHLPIGFIIGVLFPLTYPALKIFIRYEENEDVHTKDQAWKDYAGAMVGCVIGNFVEAGIIIWL
ncbi:unnamed protein product, partial [marine sediment metagenome]